MEKLTLLFKAQVPTIQFLFLSWVFLLTILKATEKMVYLVLHSRDREFFKKHSILGTLFVIALKLGALIGAIIFIAGTLYLLFHVK